MGLRAAFSIAGATPMGKSEGTSAPAARMVIAAAILAALTAPTNGLRADDAAPPLSAPLISRMTSEDPIFRQFQADVEDGRRLLALPARPTEETAGSYLAVYRYKAAERDDIFTIAARSSLPYGTVATANGLQNPQTLGPGRELLLPSIPGLFIPEAPESDLERLLLAARSGEPGVSVILRSAEGARRYRFLPGADFDPTERAFFLNAAFRYPLPVFRLTSAYGLRRNPLTGTLKVHEGLDLAAPEGTEVYAARDGTVEDRGFHAVYGNYVVIRHDGGWTSLYGHLSEILTDLRKPVRSGTLIGRVGSTGQSTGAHLHFELRQNGAPRNPANLLPTKGSER